MEYGARLAGCRAVVVAPTAAPATQLEAVRALGAEVVVHGTGVAQAWDGRARKPLGWPTRTHLVGAVDEPAVVLAHATVYLELFVDHPDPSRQWLGSTP